ncbi:hypothetical protein LAY57_05170 [Argonema antarcticum A004/B2]|uniref:hypothetical protein n=1 Tax=Argonema antarcticum TaxID=2942763 RepID=UPI0030DA2C26|nr:hypothetical protein [Argonema antarcticum A004/B2]
MKILPRQLSRSTAKAASMPKAVSFLSARRIAIAVSRKRSHKIRPDRFQGTTSICWEKLVTSATNIITQKCYI